MTINCSRVQRKLYYDVVNLRTTIIISTNLHNFLFFIDTYFQCCCCLIFFFQFQFFHLFIFLDFKILRNEIQQSFELMLSNNHCFCCWYFFIQRWVGPGVLRRGFKCGKCCWYSDFLYQLINVHFFWCLSLNFNF